MNPILGEGSTIIPADAASTVVTGMLGVFADNIVPIIALLGLMLGVGLVFRKFGAAKKGKA